ncbi:hypothetical protein FW781_07480 (plasmid) [Chryseobacterium panacisoli]|uniref:Uncharacterized protein n=1 Tax=Chryseobacterium panacisoli TaxID=1807141 RepID=A0A5D8ZZI3_9FLAO|nr:hypothetical protein [Chryseobacterium panacisoli]TZF99760.1 hypothetical protein FW781_07480 [Chryseobacterium panacisoli]
MKRTTVIFKVTLLFTYLFYSGSFCLAMPIFNNGVQAENKITFTSDNPIFTNKSLSTKEMSKLLDFYTDVFSSETQLSKWYSSVYDSSALLYIPIQYAYDTQNQELINKLRKLFTYNALVIVKKNNQADDLAKRTFYFTVSEYLRRNGIKDNAENTKMYNFIKNEVLYYWNNNPANIWEAESKKFYGAKQRIDYILSGNFNGNLSYYRAITDFELYVMGTGVSLLLIEKDAKRTITPDLVSIKDRFYQVLKKEVSFKDNTSWYLQSNIWRDHPDFKDVALEKSQNVNWDASHFSRMSAYLHLLKLNFQDDKSKYSYLEKLTVLLSNQLITNIAVYNSKNNVYTFNNYIDGNNSSFRSDIKDGKKGIQPSQNFEHIFIGWWKMLNTNEVDIMYERIAKKFPYYSEQSAYLTHDKGFFQEIVNLK